MIIFDKEQERTKFNDKIFLLLLNTMCSCDNPSWWEKNSAAPVTDAPESLRTQLDRHLRSTSLVADGDGDGDGDNGDLLSELQPIFDTT